MAHLTNKLYMNSLSSLLKKLLLSLILPLLICMLVLNSIMLYYVRRQQTQVAQNMTQYFVDEFDKSLDAISNYMIMIAAENANCIQVAYYTPTDLYQLYVHRLYNQFKSDILLYPIVQYLFFVDSSENVYILIPSSNQFPGADIATSSIYEYLNTAINNGEFVSDVWALTEINQVTYAQRVLDLNDCFLGALIPISAIADNLLEKYNFSNTDFTISTKSIDESTFSGRIDRDIHSRNFVITLKPNESILTVILTVIVSLMIVITIAALMSIPVFTRNLRSIFLDPIEVIVKHMKSISHSQRTPLTYLPEPLGGEETSLISKSFNRMIAEVEKLKISIYEEKLSVSNLELQCLRLQLKPHFFLNTMNSLYLLSRRGENEKIQTIIKNMTIYFRSIFFNSSNCIPLIVEIDRCKAYIHINQLRSFDSLRVCFNVDSDIQNYTIPPLCVLTFIENSLKHASDHLNSLTILVTIQSEIVQDGLNMIHISIEDDGDGFSEDSLTFLNSEKIYQNPNTGHIGIYNIAMRLHHIYGGKERMMFSNRQTGGAMVQLWIPFKANGEVNTNECPLG